MRSLVSMLLVAVSTTGCATARLVGEVTGRQWQQGEVSKVEASGAVERRLLVSARHVAGPAVVPEAVAPAEVAPPQGSPVEAPAPPVVLQPAPDPGVVLPTVPQRPWPQGALALTCNAEQRAERERVTRTVLRYDATWKPLTAVMFVIETAFSAILLTTGFRNGPPEGATVGLGAFFGLDAIGTALLFFHPPEVQHRVTEARGAWRPAGRECPAGLVVRTPTGDFPVATSGEVPVIGPWMLQTAVATPDAPLSLSLKGRDAPLQPSLQERCWWSGLSQSPAPFCSGVGREPEPTSVAFPV